MTDTTQGDGGVAIEGGPSPAQERPDREERGDADAPADAADADARRSGEALLLGADSDRDPTITFVLPTMNEAGGITACIERILDCLETLQVHGEIVVSDSSTDATPDIADRMGAIVVEPDREGYGYAYQYAFERARGDYLAIGDADTTYDFGELPKLYDHVANGDADVAIGSRLEGEIKPGAMPALHRYVGNPLLTRFLNVFYDAGVSDAHSGMRVIDADALDDLELESTGMEFASEMIMAAAAQGQTIVEEPITYYEREGEATLESFTDGWRHVRFMLENAPGYLFTVPGLVMTVLGALAMALTLAGVSVGQVGFRAHSMFGGSLLTIVGVQVLSMGAFATVAGNPIRTPEDPLTRLLMNHVGLREGGTLGLAIFGVGAALGVSMLGRWVASGFSHLPLQMLDVVAFTAIVVGIQVVFNAFFLSAIRE